MPARHSLTDIPRSQYALAGILSVIIFSLLQYLVESHGQEAAKLHVAKQVTLPYSRLCDQQTIEAFYLSYSFTFLPFHLHHSLIYLEVKLNYHSNLI